MTINGVSECKILKAMLGRGWHSIMSTEKIVWTSHLEFKIETPNREVHLDNKSALQRCCLFFIFSMIATLIPFENTLKKERFCCSCFVGS